MTSDSESARCGLTADDARLAALARAAMEPHYGPHDGFYEPCDTCLAISDHRAAWSPERALAALAVIAAAHNLDAAYARGNYRAMQGPRIDLHRALAAWDALNSTKEK